MRVECKRKWHSVPRQLLNEERLLRKRIEKQFKSMAQKIAERLKAEDKLLMSDIEWVIDDSHKIIIDHVVRSWKKMSKYGSKVLAYDLSVSVDWNLLDQEAVKYFDTVSSLHLSQRDGSILKTTQDGIKRVIQKWLEEWLSYGAIAWKIQEQVWAWVFSKARAEVIAINQLAKAYETWRSDVIKQKKREWINFMKIRDTVNDDRVTMECNANAGQSWIAEQKKFGSWDDHAPRWDHPRCRCTTNYRILEHGEFFDNDDSTYDSAVWPKR